MASGMRRTTLVLLALIAFAAGPARAQSQAANGTIEGTIKDGSGGLLPGVTVTVHNTDTGAERVVITEVTIRPDCVSTARTGCTWSNRGASGKDRGKHVLPSPEHSTVLV